jgi:hypothetical protein
MDEGPLEEPELGGTGGHEVGTNPDRRGSPQPVSAGPGDGSLPRMEAVKDEQVRRWDVVTPAATRIGRAEDPEDDLSERLRRLHQERHPAMAGHSERMHRLEKLRITQAICSALGCSRWERDRALGVVDGIDLTTFGSQRGVAKVALVVIQHVVDAERRRRLGLDDAERVASLSPDEMAALYEAFTSLKDEDRYRSLLEEEDLDVTSVNRLDGVLSDQIEERDLHGAALGRAPDRDPNLPALARRHDEEDSERWTDYDGGDP